MNKGDVRKKKARRPLSVLDVKKIPVIEDVSKGIGTVYKRTVEPWFGNADAKRIFRREYDTPGVPPGTYEIPEQGVSPPRILVTTYNENMVDEMEYDSIKDAFSSIETGHVTWIDIMGTPTVEMMEYLEKRVNIHPLILEDVVTLGQRPKVDEYPGALYVIADWYHLRQALEVEQLSIYVTEKYMLTFQEEPTDSFIPIRERLRSGRGRIRRLGVDYLLYAVLDLLIDRMFPLLDSLGDILEVLEDRIVSDPKASSLQAIHKIKRELMLLRKGIVPLRLVLSTLVKMESPIISDNTGVFLRDTYDHSIQIGDIIDSYRDLASGLQDLYMSSISNRMNEVMKVLTIIATIFIPLSFVAGLYGMNFDTSSPFNMPELGWYMGYPFVLLLMLTMSGGMLIFFRWKRWL